MQLDANSQADLVGALRTAGCVFAEDEARLIADAAADSRDLARLTARRCSGEPLEHVVGWAEFYGARIAVDTGVFVPRRRTELMADEAIRLARRAVDAKGRQQLTVVDLCTGSAAVAVTVATVLRGDGYQIDLHVSDVDPVAVACARRNVATVGGHMHQGDLFEALPSALAGTIDVMTANTPYVPTDEIAWMPPEARVHEPPSALDGGADGLEIARRLVASAKRWLAPGGHVIVETSDRQSEALVAAGRMAGLDAWVVADAEIGGTIVVASPGGR